MAAAKQISDFISCPAPDHICAFYHATCVGTTSAPLKVCLLFELLVVVPSWTVGGALATTVSAVGGERATLRALKGEGLHFESRPARPTQTCGGRPRSGQGDGSSESG